MKIKADRMAELEKFGYRKEQNDKIGYVVYCKIAKNKNKTLFIQIIPYTGGIWFWDKRYLRHDEVDVATVLKDLISAGMVEL